MKIPIQGVNKFKLAKETILKLEKLRQLKLSCLEDKQEKTEENRAESKTSEMTSKTDQHVKVCNKRRMPQKEYLKKWYQKTLQMQ